ncbi:hypothetical protein LTR94_033143, partial [Friedmanniomyces endolithicus]
RHRDFPVGIAGPRRHHLAHARDAAFGIGEGAVLFEEAGTGQEDVGEFRGFIQEEVLHHHAFHRAQRRFDVSYAVNSLTQTDVQKIAPKSYADLLGTVPGIQVEATGGEVQNITRVRGIPTDRGYLIFQQDGLPLYHEIDGVFFNSGEGMNRYDLMT